mmetsp:Transcript_20548/g.63525  ORF Transcript_20548/g.63525 Transcript_20548/m.63525 type:complete len:127 (+) Transcript_20548:525-905(+)
MANRRGVARLRTLRHRALPRRLRPPRVLFLSPAALRHHRTEASSRRRRAPEPYDGRRGLAPRSFLGITPLVSSFILYTFRRCCFPPLSVTFIILFSAGGGASSCQQLFVKDSSRSSVLCYSIALLS